MGLKLTNDVAKTILAAITDTDAVFDPAATYVGPYESVVNHGAATVMGDLTRSAGNLGTALAATAWGTPHKLSDGRWAVDSDPIELRPASTDDATTVAGFFLADAATAGNLLAFAPISPSVPLAGPDDLYTIIVRMTVDPAGKWDASIMFNG